MNQTILSQQGQRQRFDAIVVGSGIAALSYVLELSRLRPQTKIALVTKLNLHESNSLYAQGGIAAAKGQDDSVKLHVQDTLKAGQGLCHVEAVEGILGQGEGSIDFLLEQGVEFDKNSEGILSRAQEAGHSRRRIYHSGDQTGAAIIDKLTAQVKNLKNLIIFEYYTAISLITCQRDLKPGIQPEVIGLYVLENESGFIHTFLASVTVLATGGAGKVYRYTTNPEVATGDGIAMAYRAGARVGNMEFYQFHPTLLYHPEKLNFLLTEALRGEGAYLRLPKTGERFMKRYDKKAMELATRDVVAKAIFNEIERTGYDYVYLDIRHHDEAFLKKRFPSIYHTLAGLGLNLAKDLIPVVPAAHYLCGGILTDIHGQTDLSRLYAIGETAFTGLHGANRLASNSLLEGIVMARNAANHSLTCFDKAMQEPNHLSDWVSTCMVDTRRSIQISAHWRGLRGEMSAYAGIIRTEAGLQDMQRLIALRKNTIESYYWRYQITRDLIELRNILLIAELIVQSALKRQESRGNHYREDYPLTATQPFTFAKTEQWVGAIIYDHETFSRNNIFSE